MNRTVEQLKPDRKPDFVLHSDKGLYLERWELRPRTKAGPNAYLHHIVGGDPDRHLHDHPWDNTSIILKGGYWEQITNTGSIDRFLYRPEGSVVNRMAETPHKIVMYEGMEDCWSLFITGPVRRVWGFHTEDTWTPFNEYLVRYRPGEYEKYTHQTYKD